MALFKRGAVWWFEYYANGQRRRVSLDVTDRKLADIAVGEIRKAIEKGNVNLKTFDETRSRPVAAIASDYLAELRRLGRDPAYLASVKVKLDRLLAGFHRVQEITTDAARKALERITREHGLSPKTSNYYRTALHGLFAWLVAEDRWGDNPVQAIKRADALEPARRRRALMPEEINRLLATAKPRRALVYRVALTTGLRRSELKALRWGDVDLDAATLTLRASVAKNRRETVLPLPASTVAALAAAKGSATPEDRVFAWRLGKNSTVPRMATFNEDIEKAGIGRGAPETGVIDFHSLRVTFATSLARADVPLVLAQRLMRHSTPALTANVYTRLELHDGRAAVAKIALPCGRFSSDT